MAYDRWDDDDTYRPRRYGNDSDYERNFWQDRESRARWQRERYGAPRDRDEYRNYGDEWTRGKYGNEWSGRDYGSDWNPRDRGTDWSRREPGDRGRGSRGERGFWDRTKDEVRSWFGDEEAEHRREADHRGRGPRGYTRSDDRIRDDVSDWLMEDSYVDASDIEVVVVAGEVTLTGNVDSRDMKWRAENLAADVLGVKDVHNRLRTRSRQMYGTSPAETTGTTSSQASSAATGGSTNVSTTPRH